MEKKRIEWIDQVKGFAIICMVISHAIPGYTNGLKNWITSFNMPLFFFVSGCLAKDRVRGWNELPEYLKKKFYTLGIPYYVFCLVYLLFIAALSVLSGTDVSRIISEMYSGLKSTILMFGVQSMWFLPIHFFAMMIFDFGITNIVNKQVRFILVAGTVSILLAINSFGNPNMWIRLFGKILAAMIFIIAGNLLKPIFVKMNSGITVIALICISVLSIVNGFVSVNFEYGNYPLLFFVNAIVLSICICSLFVTIELTIPSNMRTFLNFYGRNTIVVLVTNNMVIEILRLLDFKIAGNFFLENGTFGFLLFSMLIILVEYYIILKVVPKMPGLFGLKQFCNT